MLCYCSTLNDSQTAKTTRTRIQREERVRREIVKRWGSIKKDKEKWIMKREGSENISKKRELGNQKTRQK